MNGHHFRIEYGASALDDLDGHPLANARKFFARLKGWNADCAVTSNICMTPRPPIVCAWATIESCLTWKPVLSSSAGLAIEKMFMTKTAEKTVVRSIHQKREQIATLREELEDLNDYLDLAEARVRDEGKPRLTHAEVKKRYGLK
jgi:hypothetical protein